MNSPDAVNASINRLYVCACISLSVVIMAIGLSVFYGLMNDDYLFIRVFDLQYYGNHLSEQLLRAFSFFPSATENQSAIAQGYTQSNWWTPRDIEHRFFRPLAAFTHYLDYRFLNRQIVLMHIHNYAYVLLSLGLLIQLLRQFKLTPVQQILIAALFFVDSASLWSGWIAQRNAYMALSAMFATLIVYVRFLQTGNMVSYFCAILLFCVGLLSSEAGIVTSVFLFFLPVVFRKPVFSARHFLQMVPFAIICLSFLLMYRHMDFGVHNHPFYINPFTEPVDGILSLGKKLPFFMLSAIGIIPAEAAYSVSDFLNTGTAFVVFAVLNILVLSGFYAVWKIINTENRPLFAYGVLCSFFALLPLTGSMIADRSGTFVKVGIAIALGVFILQITAAPYAGKKWQTLLKQFMPVILVIKAVVILLASVIIALIFSKPDPALAPLKSIQQPAKHIVYIKVHDIFFTAYLLEKIRYNYDDRVKTAHRLVANNSEVVVERINAQTITLSAKDNVLLNHFDVIMDDVLFQQGQQFDAGIMNIEIVSEVEGMPDKIRVNFLVPVQDILFVNYANEKYETISLPAPGNALTL